MFFKTNQYYGKSISAKIGGIIYVEVSKNIEIEGSLFAEGSEGFQNNDISLGSSAGGSIFLKAQKFFVNGNSY